MENIVGVISAGAVLLVMAGAQKMIDPWPAATALRQAGLPSSRRLVRFGAGAETLLGAAFLAAGTVALALAVAAVYLGFAAFVVFAMRSGVDGSCGCFGREDTPPSRLHVVVDLGLAGAAVAYAASGAAAPVDVVAEVSWVAAAQVLSVAVLSVVLVAAFTLVPRTFAAIRPARP